MSNINIPRDYIDNVDRALHNLYREKRTTFHPMTAIPIYYRRMFPGDKFKFRVAESLLQSHPTFAPLLANWRLRFEWYFDSDANHYGWIDNNDRLTPEEVMDRRHHTFDLKTIVFSTSPGDLSRLGTYEVVGRGGVDDYAGIAPGFISFMSTADANEDPDKVVKSGRFNLDFHLTYLNIIRNYHVNRQFSEIPYINSWANASGAYFNYDVRHMDNLFKALRLQSNGINIDLNSTGARTTIEDWTLENEDYEIAFDKFKEWLRICGTPNGGLFCTQYEPDLFQNLLNTDRNSLKSYVQVTNGQMSIESFRLANHLQHLYDIIFVGGSTSRELSRSRWGVKSNRDYDIPELISVHSEIIGTNLITSNNAGSSTPIEGEDSIESAPGDMAGNLNERRGGSTRQSFTARTSGNLMCIMTLTPLVDYCQNVERHLYEHYFEDSFTPQMARKGFEKVPLSDYSVLPGVNLEGNTMLFQDYFASIGTQVAWLREMTDTNRCHGEFSNGGEMTDYVLARKFSRVRDTFTTPSNGVPYNYYGQVSFSPYGNPLEWQYPFVSQDIYSPNFYVQVAFDVSAYRPIGRRYMPTIGM